MKTGFPKPITNTPVCQFHKNLKLTKLLILILFKLEENRGILNTATAFSVVVVVVVFFNQKVELYR